MVSDLVVFIKRRDAQLREAMKAELEALVIEGKPYLEGAVRNWTEKPKWKISSQHNAQELRVILETIGEMRNIFGWVDKGTGSHVKGGHSYIIAARNPTGRLWFRPFYNAKTQPIAKANVGNGRKWGPLVSPEMVEHPGIEGRKFSKTYREKILLPNFKPRIVKRVRRT